MAIERTNRPVKRGKPLILLLRTPEADRRSGGSFWAAIAEQARFMGWNVLDTRHTYGAIPEGRKADGAVTALGLDDPVVRELLQQGVPVVRRPPAAGPDDESIPTVLPDVRQWGRIAAEHFAQRGITDVGYIGREPWSNRRDLYEAFSERAAELDCECHLLRLVSETGLTAEARHEKRETQVSAWLKNLPKPVGLLSFGDDRAALTCSICLQAGISVPEEVAILGIGNIHAECELAPVPLSSIDTALTRRGQAVVRLLQGLMEGRPPPKRPILVPPSRVVVRSSTDVLAVKDQNVAKAMRYMWGHLSENISVDIVADAVGVNRRRLERLFRTHLRRSISSELRRKRLERCRELLRGTDYTVTDIAAMIGFTSADYLHASFKKAFGITPQTYRMRK